MKKNTGKRILSRGLVAALAIAGITLLPVQAAEADASCQPISVLCGTAYVQEYDDTTNELTASVTYPELTLLTEDAELYPKLAEGLKSLNQERKDLMLSTFEEYALEGKEALQQGDEYFSGYTADEKALLRRADSQVVSVLLDGSSYNGGAHGYYYYVGINYDTVTGEEIDLWNIVKDKDAFITAVQEAVDYYYPELSENGGLTVAEYFDTASEIPSWTLDPYGVTLYFNVYTLGSYAEGAQIVSLPFSTYADLFEAAYQTVPEAYTMYMTTGIPYYDDLNGDGAEDRLVLSTVAGESYGVTLTAELNGQTYTEELDGYSADMVLVHAANGNNYLYIQVTQDNDYRALYVYAVGDTMEYVNYMAGGWYQDPEAYDGDTYIARFLKVQNPEFFFLATRTSYLGTSSVYAGYHVGEDGMPSADEEWYYEIEPQTLTLLQDLEVTLVDGYTGEEQGTETIPAGAAVQTYRTDNASYADVVLEDGNVGRIYINHTNYPYTIDGIDENELFDGLMYAG